MIGSLATQFVKVASDDDLPALLERLNGFVKRWEDFVKSEKCHDERFDFKTIWNSTTSHSDDDPLYTFRRTAKSYRDELRTILMDVVHRDTQLLALTDFGEWLDSGLRPNDASTSSLVQQEHSQIVDAADPHNLSEVAAFGSRRPFHSNAQIRFLPLIQGQRSIDNRWLEQLRYLQLRALTRPLLIDPDPLVANDSIRFEQWYLDALSAIRAHLGAIDLENRENQPRTDAELAFLKVCVTTRTITDTRNGTKVQLQNVPFSMFIAVHSAGSAGLTDAQTCTPQNWYEGEWDQRAVIKCKLNKILRTKFSIEIEQRSWRLKKLKIGE